MRFLCTKSGCTTSRSYHIMIWGREKSLYRGFPSTALYYGNSLSAHTHPMRWINKIFMNELENFVFMCHSRNPAYLTRHLQLDKSEARSWWRLKNWYILAPLKFPIWTPHSLLVERNIFFLVFRRKICLVPTSFCDVKLLRKEDALEKLKGKEIML